MQWIAELEGPPRVQNADGDAIDDDRHGPAEGPGPPERQAPREGSGAPKPFERPPAPWRRPSGLGSVIARWKADPKLWANVVMEAQLPSRAATHVPIPDGLHGQVAAALGKLGLSRLYTHQAEAFARARDGQDIVVATPTASGKSLAYNLPVLDALARAPEARALYLFPTKALSRDQEHSLRGILRDTGLDHGAVTYDGDTPADARRSARDRCGVLITNPDMLHTSILPHHARWARLLADLKYVVVDEVHAYRGVFGSHLANVLRRLLRAARFHGARPQLLFSSATIGNPEEHASRLAGRPVHAITESGAPSGTRRVVLCNPPIVNAELGIRRSCTKETVRWASDLVHAGVPTIVFGQSRNQVEVMLKYLRDAVAGSPIPADCIQAYRGGYLSDTRRRIERGLRDGSVRCVVATHALELGIDIGSLEAVICAGFPGTMAGLWQRFGRAGRRSDDGESLAVLVASSSPLDQFLAGDPRLLVDAPVEQARIDPDNVEILLQHLKCAAFELPFDEAEGFGGVPIPSVQEALQFLADHRVLHVVSRGGVGADPNSERRIYHWSAEAFPAHHVPLRSITWDNFVIIDVETKRTLAEMDFRSAHTMLHEQAIYQHDGRQYQVEFLDYANHKAFVRSVEPDYYTTALTNTKVTIVAEGEVAPRDEAGPGPVVACGFGDVVVVEKVVGFKKIKFHTHENVGYGDVHLPAVEKPTTAFWVTVPETVLSALPAPRAVVMDALRGWLTAMHAVAAVGLMIDPKDLGQAVVDEPGAAAENGRARSDGEFEPTLFLYDSVAGGIGLAPRLFAERLTLIQRAFELVDRCRCAEGCPSCIGPMVAQTSDWSRRELIRQFGDRTGLWRR